MFDNIYIQQRIQKANALRELGINPYRNDSCVSMHNQEFLEKFSYLKDIESDKKQDFDAKIWIKGRIKFLRLMGKASFIKVEDSTALLQVYFSQNELGDLFKILKKNLDVGDIVNICGFPFVTKTGELSIHAVEFKLLTKSIIPLPEKFHGLSDIELRYRQRYVDLIVNADVRNTFIIRSKIISALRKFFEHRGFLEVETPMLHPIPGGANARPFITHHNALNVERYLRIAPELYLKRLIVGGFEAIFEINRNFRNEGIDHSHNPEFSTIEFYWAYRDFNDLINLTKDLLVYLLESLNLPKIIPFDNMQIDFDKFDIIDYKESLNIIGKIDPGIIQDKEKLEVFLTQNNIKIESNLSYDKLLSEAFDNFVESKLINPTFIINYPIDISPLARRNDSNLSIADRFELFIGGREIANGFSELNDPIDQLERFKAQVAEKEKGDMEAQYMDEDFVWALGHGMPPTAGEGIGIDRLIMLLTNNKSIKDVIFFPAMKPTTENYNINKE
ncbi:lysine--tRNA ligase [Helicobacter muridarum]|uniref:Lysine--tRNA ligase n=1 Tax=Helicobacter muridarum TaxID=216 RepID=A0A099TW49_9HELI|nr:lysine--tRNA ligase [Helicobacter muridarum]TLE01358.1 lysine--tRNA ligase [Helicobacter muridarum]STQ85283.1 lysyl-tRNA synthetase [Helicobacter muridarum]